MKKYSVIVFDLGNVLIPFDYSLLLAKLDFVEEGLGKKFEALYNEYYDVHRSFERGEVSRREFLDAIHRWTGEKLSDIEFCIAYSSVFKEDRKVTSLLPELKKRYKLVLLSNTNEIHREYGWGHYKFLENFDKLILSHEAGAVKPEEKIYEAVMNYTNLPAEEHIFIDDIAEYAEGARKMGWDAIQFKRYDNLIEQFKEKGILSPDFPSDENKSEK